MPREDRRIIFDYDEVYKALYSLCVQKDRKKPPAGAITMLVADDKDDSCIYVRFENQFDTQTGPVKIEYSRDFLAAALMVYCRGCGIPLPKKARKSVMIGENDVTLRAEMYSLLVIASGVWILCRCGKHHRTFSPDILPRAR